ncbi:MAG: hypothetical protein LC725_04830 [Lentisphaerae bacterium]|nr:hypothetical protein [Lentisphaerota bacterium]
MVRGDRREPIVSDDADCEMFLETLGEACRGQDLSEIFPVFIGLQSIDRMSEMSVEKQSKTPRHERQGD